MKVKVNTINTRCILMSEAVNAPDVMMMTSIVSGESLAMDRHTDRQTHTHMDSGSCTLQFAKSQTKTATFI